jgi:hypothetical protein
MILIFVREQAAGSSGDPVGVVEIVRAAVTDGFSQAMIVAGVLLIVGGASVAWMAPRRIVEPADPG